MPKKDAERVALTQAVGRDGYLLLKAIDNSDAPTWLRQVPALRILRKVWIQNYMLTAGYTEHTEHTEQGSGDQISWREVGNIPPATIFLSTSHDPEAHYAKKRSTSWVGYGVLQGTSDGDL